MPLVLALAPYVGVLVGMIGAGVYLRRSIVPAMASGWRSSKIEAGECPEEHCGGSAYMVSQTSQATLFRCVECRQTWMLTVLPRE